MGAPTLRVDPVRYAWEKCNSTPFPESLSRGAPVAAPITDDKPLKVSRAPSRHKPQPHQYIRLTSRQSKRKSVTARRAADSQGDAEAPGNTEPEPAAEQRRREKNRRYREAHPETARSVGRRYKAAHPERVREQGRLYREANREIIRERHRLWRVANRERLREWQRRYYAENPERIRAIQRRHEAKKRAARAQPSATA